VAKPGGETVLVVDDHPAVLRVVIHILRNAGFHVLTATGGQSALHIAGALKAPIDLLLSDIEMPGMSGPELGQALKLLRPDMRVMLMSGGVDGNLLVLNYGWAYIEKPFVGVKLVDMVRSVLDSPDRSQSNGQEFDIRKETARV
jgi:two-component system cell cycle sensor histidine kinase/response regulator CckA